MKSNTISVLSGIGLLVLMMAGCSGSSDVAQNSNSNNNSAVAAVGDTGGGNTVSNEAAENSTPSSKNDSARKPEPVTTETPVDASPASSTGDSESTKTEPMAKGSSDRSNGSMLASKPSESKSPKKEPTSGRKKRALGPPADPTGETGTNPGDTLPGIEGKDVDGIEFALSDYDGKVKMVDFWGDW